MSRLDEATLGTIAQRMLADYDAANPGTVFGEGLRLEIADAWRLQSAVTALREERGKTVVGYKIGCVVEDNQKAMGLPHPAWGRLWSTEQHTDGAVLNKADFANVSLEAEFAITLNRPIDPEHASAEDILSAVKAIYPVIEIHNLTFRGDPPHGAELLANNAIHAGVVRGAAIPPPGADLKPIWP